MDSTDQNAEAVHLTPESKKPHPGTAIPIEQLASITHPTLTEVAATIVDLLTYPENTDEEKLRESWIEYGRVTEAFVDSIQYTSEDPKLRSKAQIAAIINKAYIFQATGDVIRYLEELDVAEVYAANEGFDEISAVISEEIRSQVEQLELTPEVIVLKLKGILDDMNREFLKDQISEGLDLDDLIGQVYGMLLDEGEDPDEVLARLGITEI